MNYLLLFLGGTLTSMATDLTFAQTAALNIGIMLIALGSRVVES